MVSSNVLFTSGRGGHLTGTVSSDSIDASNPFLRMNPNCVNVLSISADGNAHNPETIERVVDGAFELWNLSGLSGSKVTVSFESNVNNTGNSHDHVQECCSRRHGDYRIVVSPTATATRNVLPLFTSAGAIDFSAADDRVVCASNFETFCVVIPLNSSTTSTSISATISHIRIPQVQIVDRPAGLRLRCFRGHGGGSGVERGIDRLLALATKLRRSTILSRNIATDVASEVWILGEAPLTLLRTSDHSALLGDTIVFDAQLLVAAGATGGIAAVGAHVAVLTTLRVAGPLVERWLQACAPAWDHPEISWVVARCILLQVLISGEGAVKTAASHNSDAIKRQTRKSRAPPPPALLSMSALTQFLEAEAFHVAQLERGTSSTQQGSSTTSGDLCKRRALLTLWAHLQTEEAASQTGGSSSADGQQHRNPMMTMMRRVRKIVDPIEIASNAVHYLVQRFVELPQTALEGDGMTAAITVSAWLQQLQENSISAKNASSSFSSPSALLLLGHDRPALLTLQSSSSMNVTGGDAGVAGGLAHVEMWVEQFFFQQRREQMARVVFNIQKKKKPHQSGAAVADCSGHIPCALAIFEHGQSNKKPRLVNVLRQALLLKNGSITETTTVADGTIQSVEMSFFLRVGGGEILKDTATAAANTDKSTTTPPPTTNTTLSVLEPPKFSAVLFITPSDVQAMRSQGVAVEVIQRDEPAVGHAAAWMAEELTAIHQQEAATGMPTSNGELQTQTQESCRKTLIENMVCSIGGHRLAAWAPDSSLLVARHLKQYVAADRSGAAALTVAVETMLRTVLRMILAKSNANVNRNSNDDGMATNSSVHLQEQQVQEQEQQRRDALMHEFRPLLVQHRSLAVQIGRSNTAEARVWREWIARGWGGPVAQTGALHDEHKNDETQKPPQYEDHSVDTNLFTSDDAAAVLFNQLLFPSVGFVGATDGSGAAAATSRPESRAGAKRMTLRLRPATPAEDVQKKPRSSTIAETAATFAAQHREELKASSNVEMLVQRLSSSAGGHGSSSRADLSRTVAAVLE